VRYLPGSDELVITRFREDASSVVWVQRYDPSTGAVTALLGANGVLLAYGQGLLGQQGDAAREPATRARRALLRG